MATTIETPTRDGRMAAAGRPLNVIEWVAMVLMIVGGINWGLLGILNFDLVAAIFGPMSAPTRVVYALVGLAALYGIVTAVRLGRREGDIAPA
jgi:uncharacterized protein